MFKNMKLKNTIVILLTCFFLSACGQESNSEAGGLPKLSELIGFWKKVEMLNEEKPNTVNPFPQKYQWFAFYENGKVYSMMSDNDADYTAKNLKEIFDILPAEKTPDYNYRLLKRIK